MMIRTTIAFWLLASTAAAHDWYPASCCSEKDCYPLAADDYEMTASGYLIKSTGETIPYGTERMSPDGRLHRCSWGGLETSGTISTSDGPCFWAPMMGAGL